MKVIGLTGGIGSGKTTVAKAFAALGVPLFIADDEAKGLMATSKVIHKELKALLGKEAFEDGELNRPFIASKVFGDPKLLAELNKIVHPRVHRYFKKWLKQQDAAYVIYELHTRFAI